MISNKELLMKISDLRERVSYLEENYDELEYKQEFDEEIDDYDDCKQYPDSKKAKRSFLDSRNERWKL